MFAKKIMIMFLVCVFALPAMTDVRAVEAKSTKLIIHYYRTDGQYDKWNIWAWVIAPATRNGKPFFFNGEDSFGKVAEVAWPIEVSKMGVLVRKGSWEEKDGVKDRIVEINGESKEIWMIQGDENVYDSEPQKP